MNTGDDDRFDAIARDVHAHSLDALSPRTRAQLQLRRRGAPTRTARMRTLAWPVAAACAIAALAIGWQLRDPGSMPTGAPPSTPMVATSTDDDSATLVLDENPELYEWLASSDADTLAME